MATGRALSSRVEKHFAIRARCTIPRLLRQSPAGARDPYSASPPKDGPAVAMFCLVVHFSSLPVSVSQPAKIVLERTCKESSDETTAK